MDGNEQGTVSPVSKWVADRRGALPKEAVDKLSKRTWGLALSGGGIRSATFCFGLVKVLASQGLLHRFDFLSTVSGGGYVGSAVAKLYQNEVEKALTPPATTLPAEPGPQQLAAKHSAALDIEEAIGKADTRWFGTWLRANGRYLIPRGARDALHAAANYGRNFLGVHIELAIMALLLAAVLVAVDLGVWQLANCMAVGECGGANGLEVAKSMGWVSRFPTLWIALLPISWIAAMLACAYWSLPKRSDRPIELQRFGTAAAMGIASFVVLSHWQGRGTRWTGDIELPGYAVALALMVMTAWLVGIVLAVLMVVLPKPRSLDLARNRLTGFLSKTLLLAVVIGAAGVLDWIAWSLGSIDAAMHGAFGVIVLLIAAALRAALPKVGDLPKVLAPGARGFAMTVIDIGGVLAVAGVAVFWMALTHRATTGELFGTDPVELRFGRAWQWWAWLAVPPLLLAGLSAWNREFMNRSSLYTFYKARLTRSYLGAANSDRFRINMSAQTTALSQTSAGFEPHDVAEVNPSDDVRMATYRPHLAGGPVHLINTCVNQTRDPNGGLFNQDRKGLLLTVGPEGLVRTHTGEWKEPEPDARMTLGSWMAISGAAVAPGLGASTRSGIAALLTMAGVRLGYWWDATSVLPKVKPGAPAQRILGKYGQLLSELLGRFDGDRRRDWFLSDGGHFENTGAYALLREECEVIVVADCGADPRYAFGDLENLVRKARIDLQADVVFQRPKAADKRVPGFGSLNELASSDSDACLAVATVNYRRTGQKGYMFIVKPNMCKGAPVDLVNFKADNPLFPQEPTTDQFFSEAQWESYFQLGQTLTKNLELVHLRDAETFFKDHFCDDDDAIVEDAADGSQKLRFNAKRLSSRIASTGAVSASISVGAIVSVGLAAYQGVASEVASSARKATIEPAAYKELSDLFGKLPAGIEGDSQRGAAQDRLGEMAMALLRIGDASCTDDNVEAFRRSKLIQFMLSGTRAACERAAVRHSSCDWLLTDERVPECLRKSPPFACRQMYWTRDFTAADPVRANCWAPPKTPEVSPTPPFPNGEGRECKNYTIYIKIYGGDLRDYTRTLREPWRELGASVPFIEDVLDTAYRSRKRPPTPESGPTAVYYDDAALKCVERMEKAVEIDLAPRKVAGGTEAQLRSIEAWMPPSPIGPRLSALVEQMDAPAKEVRVAAVKDLIQKYGEQREAVALSLGMLEGARLDRLTQDGRVNVLVFLSNTQASAWGADEIGRARSAISNIRSRGDKGVKVGGRTEELLAKLSTFLDRAEPKK